MQAHAPVTRTIIGQGYSALARHDYINNFIINTATMSTAERDAYFYSITHQGSEGGYAMLEKSSPPSQPILGNFPTADGSHHAPHTHTPTHRPLTGKIRLLLATTTNLCWSFRLPSPLFFSINTTTMPSNESNFTATATPSGGFSMTSDGFGAHQLAMHAMQQSGAATAVVQLSALGPDSDHPTVVTGVIDRDGNFRTLPHTHEANSASPFMRKMLTVTDTASVTAKLHCRQLAGTSDLPDDGPAAVRMMIEYLYHNTYVSPGASIHRNHDSTIDAHLSDTEYNEQEKRKGEKQGLQHEYVSAAPEVSNHFISPLMNRAQEIPKGIAVNSLWRHSTFSFALFPHSRVASLALHADLIVAARIAFQSNPPAEILPTPVATLPFRASRGGGVTSESKSATIEMRKQDLPLFKPSTTFRWQSA
ncbi:hypothetical protein FMUND_14341 [Fusarium mundagurra]|uniref:Uncharacterized protein n=1 Tax=Fusarium mundagurra TaxID=1567541 RepID=A0A8H5XV83_9HYPO|nr:hypothetical protein FMUND_14341 [Fusarium mundagurra]